LLTAAVIAAVIAEVSPGTAACVVAAAAVVEAGVFSERIESIFLPARIIKKIKIDISRKTIPVPAILAAIPESPHVSSICIIVIIL